MSYAKFGIIENFDKNKNYGKEYTPHEYNCITIYDDIIDAWWKRLSIMKSYFHCYDRPEFALARYGVTLIPPESLDLFDDIILTNTPKKFYHQIPPLSDLIQRAKRENKFIIHYGI